MKVLKCADLGNAACSAVSKAENVDEVLKQAGEHAKTAHNVVVTPEITEKMKGLVKDEAAPAAGAIPATGSAPAASAPAPSAPEQANKKSPAPKA